MRLAFLLGAGLFAAVLWPRPDAPARPEPHRSPMDVIVLPDGRRALTANHTADSASLLDLNEGRVLAEVSCGRKPVAVACSPDGRRAVVSNHWSDSVSLLEVSDTGLKVVATVPVGRLPQGVAFTRDGRCCFVAAGEEIVEIDWTAARSGIGWRRRASRASS